MDAIFKLPYEREFCKILNKKEIRKKWFINGGRRFGKPTFPALILQWKEDGYITNQQYEEIMQKYKESFEKVVRGE